jgi:catechol 2,3-dioxygenase-like lactoylglutathione lyase family enzyme
MIRNVGIIIVYVEDQEIAEEFWVKKVGFQVHDKRKISEHSSHYWLEVGPEGGATRLALIPKSLNPHWNERRSIIGFECENIKSTYDRLQESGIELGGPPQFVEWVGSPHVGTVITAFRDPDGNEFLLRDRGIIEDENCKTI